MFLPLRLKFLLVSAGVAVTALASALWALSYQLEGRMAEQIDAMLLGSESTLIQWKFEQKKYLSAEARIVAHDPRFFAAVAESDEVTALPIATEFQELSRSDLFLVSDRRGGRLAHLDQHGPVGTIHWPQTIPPSSGAIRWDGRLFLLHSQAVTVAGDTVGYVALGRQVDHKLAATMARVAGTDVVLFDKQGIFGSTLNAENSQDLVGVLKDADRESGLSMSTQTVRIDNERILYRIGDLSDGAGASYAVLMSLDQHLEPEIANLRHTTLLVGSLALLFAFAVSWSVARRMTARVPELVEAVEAVAGGRYDIAVMHHGHDELGAVAEAVERMRRELAKQIDAIRAANSERVAAERLATIGKMSSTIIHDFKTPIQVIRSSVELSSQANLPTEKRERYAAMIIRELDRMVEMAQDLLSFARGDRQTSRKTVDIVDLLCGAVMSWQQVASQKRISVSFDSPDVPIVLSIDVHKVQRALDNLVVNATEVLPPGGAIAIRCELVGRFVEISVTDNGPGIPEDIRDSIFEPFATFGKSGGSGLGLAMAKKTVEDHEGTIRVDSTVGVGTTFTISLPYASDCGVHAIEGEIADVSASA